MNTEQNKILKVGTDFSGIGSPEIALINLGINFKSMFACDYDKYAKQSYLANHTTENFYDDITTRNQEETPYVDLYVAGFPCQAFSMAGKRKGFDDTRGTLFFDLLKYLKAQKPKYFILENVKGLISHNKGQTFAVILDCLAKTINKQYSFTMYDECLGYHIYYKVLNTKDYGLPQNRERVFIVGFRDDNHSFNWPKPFKLEFKLKDILQDNPDSKYNLTQKGVSVLNNYQKFNKFKLLDVDKDIASCITARCNKISNDNNFLEVDEKYYLSDKAIDKIIRHNNKTLDKDISTCIHAGYFKGGGRDQQYIRTHSLFPRSSKTGKGGSGPLSKTDGTAYCIDTGNAQAIEWVADYRNDEGLRIRKNKMSPCLTTASVPMIKKKRIRKLTPLECLRLQGFPDDYYYKCKEAGLSDTQLYKQAGNSMTSDVMYYIIKEILKNGY